MIRIRAAVLLLLMAHGGAVAAQGPDFGSATRFGVSFGGISTVSVVVELVRDNHGFELALGTWSFRDLAFSAVAKQYLGAGGAQPFVGAGAWLVGAGGERTGVALVLRAPIGVDWSVADDHALGAALNVNLALAVRRTDPEDVIPPNRRLVPLPEVYYRWTR